MEAIAFIFEYYALSSLLGIFLIFLLYKRSIKNHNYWKERNVPFVKPYPIIGSVMEDFGKTRMENLDIERRRKFGSLYGFFEGTKPALFVADPELLRDIFVKDFQYFTNRRFFDMGDPVANKMLTVLQSEDWKRVRSVVTPTFSTGKIKRVLGIFQNCAKTVIKSFRTAATKHKSIDVLKTYGAYTMDVIASSAFSTKIDSHNDPENIFIQRAKVFFNQELGLRFIIFLFAPFVMKMLKITPFPKEPMEFFKSITLEMVRERKRTGQTRNDFLQLLIDSANENLEEDRDEENSDDIIENYKDESVNHPIFKNISTKHLSKDELVAQCVIFFIAGYHTTAITLAITTHLLAVNQDVQDKLFKEIQQTLEETNGVLTYESIQKMKYLDNIISETLRMYPPLVRLERMAHADYKLGETGLTLPKGMQIVIPIFAMHRDEKLFPEPEKFNPDRFNPEERGKLVPYSYMPFGVGPRNCVAMRFALVEVKVCLIQVFSTFHVNACPETKVPLELEKGLGLIRCKPVILQLSERDNCPLRS